MPKTNGFAESQPKGHFGEEVESTQHTSRRGTAKRLGRGCCPGLTSKNKLIANSS